MIGHGDARASAARFRAPFSEDGVLAAPGIILLGLALLLLLVTGKTWVVLAVAIIAPLTVALTRRPQLGILLLAALLPYHGLLLLVPHPGALDAWKEALVVATLAATWLAPAQARGSPGRRLPVWLLAVAGLFATSLVAAAARPGLASLVALKIVFFFVLAFLAVWRCPLSARERDRLITLLMANSVLTALYGIAQQAIGHGRLHAWGYEYDSAIRFTGGLMRSFSSFATPYEFAYFSAVVLLVCLPVALSEPSRARNRLYLWALPVVGAGLVTSASRGAWLAVGVGIAYLGFQRNRALLLAVPIGLVALVVIPFWLPHELSSAALSTRSAQKRGINWETHVHELVTHPLGVGLGTAGAAAEKAQKLKGLQRISFYEPDNEYVLHAYELGVIGLWWYLLQLGYAFAWTRRCTAALRGQDAAFAAGTSAMVLAAAVLSGIAVYFETYPASQLWWILFGVVAAACAEGETQREPSRALSAVAGAPAD